MESSIHRSYRPQELGDSLSHAEHPQTRPPLALASGNPGLQEVAYLHGHTHHESKENVLRDRSPYVPVLPSQPSRHANTLQLRKQSNRRQRNNRLRNSNPVLSSPQYLAYRQRQTREGNDPENAKWPDSLENAFLDGNYLPMLTVPC